MKLKLHNLSPRSKFGKGRKSKKRLGRGPGSMLGKTSGKGHKGQKSRSGGGPHRHFEGGQMPLYRRLPKIGFKSRKKNITGKNSFLCVPLDALNKFEEGAKIGIEELSGIGFKPSRAGRNSAGVKLLAGKTKLTKKLEILVSACSKSAQKQIEEAGGSINFIPTSQVADKSATASA